MDETDGCIAIASEYDRGIYANALETLSSKTTSYEDVIFLVLSTYTIYHFYYVEFQRRYRENPFAIGDTYLTPFC